MTEYFTIAIIAILGAMSPGPDFAVVSKNALTYSRQAGYYTSLGILTGLIVHSSYCILGLAIIIAHSTWLLLTLKYVGSAYLIYLGIKALLAKNEQLKDRQAKQKKLANIAAWKEGFLVNVLNPKCALFIITIFTVIVKPHTPLFAQIIYGIELAGLGALWFIMLSYLLTHGKINQPLVKIQTIITKLLGIFLIFVGIHIAFHHLH
ncbi:MAG: lysine transporter LysE [Legionellaceae bacterium]|nr:lysine transporter LysE [Legionellaceae bacterium]|tara:strand:+ start:894 stop:1511 length:618 start_codon:yes stop_codon:yes gene_type:complete